MIPYAIDSHTTPVGQRLGLKFLGVKWKWTQIVCFSKLVISKQNCKIEVVHIVSIITFSYYSFVAFRGIFASSLEIAVWRGPICKFIFPTNARFCITVGGLYSGKGVTLYSKTTLQCCFQPPASCLVFMLVHLDKNSKTIGGRCKTHVEISRKFSID